MQPWKLLKSQIVFDNFMKIEERTYEMPDGQTKNFYIKLTSPSVCVLALTEDNKVITVEQFRPGPNRILNELPGGMLTRVKPVKRRLLENSAKKPAMKVTFNSLRIVLTMRTSQWSAGASSLQIARK